MKIKVSKVATLLLVLVVVSFQNSAFAKVEAVLGSLALKDNPNLATQLPLTNNPEIILSRPQYIISYNKDRRTPNWVAWKLEANQIGATGRSNLFAVDSELENYLSSADPNQHAVTSTDYSGSCFDRGHQIPSADRTDLVVNNEATFLMSNMIPQTPYLNRVIWEHLEQHTRQLVQTENKKVYVIAGPIYDQNFGAIGPKADIQVPSKDFKVIVILDANQTIADITPSTPMITVIMPNTLEDGSNPTIGRGCSAFATSTLSGSTDWQKYQTTLSEIEKLSGITLFPKFH
ncbi:MAG: DNA/RNA non-specific endonuclease [Bdellovibrio sp.]|nr:DNA/RNA non-specific endonuclease [Bdellovibrio sp.]